MADGAHVLVALAGDDEASVAHYRTEVLGTRKSLIDLLDECPACELPFNVYLELLSPLAPRYTRSRRRR